MRTFVLDYGAGNVRSIVNAIAAVGHSVEPITCVADFELADRLVFPGVGAFGACMERLAELGYVAPLRAYLASGKPFLGICLGMQTLFESSEESPGVAGLGAIPGAITRFMVDKDPESLAVPHIGWNGVNVRAASAVFCAGAAAADEHVYFVHSFVALPTPACQEWILTTTNYGSCEFVSAVRRGNILVCIVGQY